MVNNNGGSYCPMENQCLTQQIVYRADVSNNKDNETKFYYGLTETSLKKRHGNHKRSFIHEQHKNDTELSKYIWDLTSSHKVPTIKWCIVRKIHGNAKSDFHNLNNRKPKTRTKYGNPK